MSVLKHIQYTCFDSNNPYGKILYLIAPYILITGVQIIFHIFKNPHSTKKGWMFAFIPSILSICASIISYLFGSHRSRLPHEDCLPTFYFEYTFYMAPELVWFMSSIEIDLIHGIIYQEEENTGMAMHRLFGIFLQLALIPILSYMIYVVTISEIIGSSIFSLLSIVLYRLFHTMYCYWYGDCYDQ